MYEPFANFTSQQVANLAVQFHCDGNLNYQHLWYFGDSTNSTLAEPLHQYLYADSFIVHHVVFDGCRYDSATFTAVATVTTAIQQTNSHPCEVVYNQQMQVLSIDFKNSVAKNVQLELYNNAGAICLKEKFNGESRKIISLKSFVIGNYIAKVFDADANVCIAKKFVLIR